MSDRLLIIGCSKAKIKCDELLPAYKLYDGPRWRIFRNNMPLTANQPRVIVVSAQYGIIKPTTLLPYYDKQWKGSNWRRDVEWVRPQYQELLRPRLMAGLDIFVAAGESYRNVLEACGILQDVIAAGSVYHAPIVPLGVGLQMFKAWLLEQPS